MKKKLLQYLKNTKNVTVLLTIICICLMGLNMFQSHQFSKMLNHTTQRYTELMISQEPDYLESDLPHKKLGRFELTFYCPCEKCVGKKSVVRTATGTKPKAKRTIAVDPRKIPLGSIVYIEGYGYFIAEDTGSAVKQNIIDIYVDTHEEALQNGRRIANVYLLQ